MKMVPSSESSANCPNRGGQLWAEGTALAASPSFPAMALWPKEVNVSEEGHLLLMLLSHLLCTVHFLCTLNAPSPLHL